MLALCNAILSLNCGKTGGNSKLLVLLKTGAFEVPFNLCSKGSSVFRAPFFVSIVNGKKIVALSGEKESGPVFTADISKAISLSCNFVEASLSSCGSFAINGTCEYHVASSSLKKEIKAFCVRINCNCCVGCGIITTIKNSINFFK